MQPGLRADLLQRHRIGLRGKHVQQRETCVPAPVSSASGSLVLMAQILAQIAQILHRESASCIRSRASAPSRCCAACAGGAAEAGAGRAGRGGGRAAHRPRRAGGARAARGRRCRGPPAACAAATLGLVINTADPYSVQVGEYYAARARPGARRRCCGSSCRCARTLGAGRVRRACRSAIADHFGDDIQALALAWSQPYAVGCHSITGALALGFDADAVQAQLRAVARVAATSTPPRRGPARDLGLRPSMLLAAPDVARRGADRPRRRGRRQRSACAARRR